MIVTQGPTKKGLIKFPQSCVELISYDGCGYREIELVKEGGVFLSLPLSNEKASDQR